MGSSRRSPVAILLSVPCTRQDEVFEGSLDIREVRCNRQPPHLHHVGRFRESRSTSNLCIDAKNRDSPHRGRTAVRRERALSCSLDSAPQRVSHTAPHRNMHHTGSPEPLGGHRPRQSLEERLHGSQHQNRQGIFLVVTAHLLRGLFDLSTMQVRIGITVAKDPNSDCPCAELPPRTGALS